ncbi:hypothetical protein V5O48_015925 [Marasmius crinis-equi]|uniref:Uncharacterized protein n=1 Tax=Marasmius crinis-equi TaxID=585013 RepID=A0ABR3ET40_9AGAR
MSSKSQSQDPSAKKRNHDNEQQTNTPLASTNPKKMTKQHSEGIDMGNMIKEKRKRKEMEKMKGDEINSAGDEPKKTKKTKKTKKKEAVDSAKDMKGYLLKNGVDVCNKVPLKKALSKAVDTFQDDMSNEEQPPRKRARTGKEKAHSKSAKKSSKTTQPFARSPSPTVEEVDDPEETPQQQLGRS